jgi:hypothetical protein
MRLLQVETVSQPYASASALPSDAGIAVAPSFAASACDPFPQPSNNNQQQQQQQQQQQPQHTAPVAFHVHVEGIPDDSSAVGGTRSWDGQLRGKAVGHSGGS